ncbi:MAG: ABC transporter transmembrane domain-containing protein [Reyranellaceae bacterium]
MEKSLFRYVWRHTKAEQFSILLIIILAQVFYFLSLNIPKNIVNEAIQGRSFPKDAAGHVVEGSTTNFFTIDIPIPGFLSDIGSIRVFDGFALEQIPYLFALSFLFLAMVIINGQFKLNINTMKGRMGERMLRRLRYELFDRVMRFPQNHFRKVKQAEIATMVKDEVEPLGGFIGDAFVQPVFLGGQAATALFFIVTQSFWLGMVAVGVLAIQIGIIPKLRKRVLALGKERQITARQLAGRIAEAVDGSADIHANATSNYERADIANRLGHIFRIRFELYKRKFTVKFLNNLLAQTTPFLFYLIGGYLAIKGQLDIGGLVAVIAAYKDLPPPIKELIDWDQQRQDVQIKYEQVIEQFTPDAMLDPALQAPLPENPPALDGSLVLSGVSVFDDSHKLLDGASLDIDTTKHVALIGPPNGGKEAIALLLARLLYPASGHVRIGQREFTALPEIATGARIGYAGADTYLFPVSVRENILYGLKQQERVPADYDEAEKLKRQRYFDETRRAGNPLFDVNAGWIDYRATGCADLEEIDRRILDLLPAVELDDDVYRMGLRGTIDPDAQPEVAGAIMQARAELHQRLADPQVAALIEPFSRDRYVRNMSVAENLLFGTAANADFVPERLAQNALVQRVLDEQGLTGDFLRMGREIAETMVELFADLPPGHPFFEQFSFIAAEDLPEFRVMVARIAGKGGAENVSADDRARLMALPFPYIEARHRLGLVDEDMQARLLEARAALADALPEGAVEVYDREKYNRAATIQDNILFGRLIYGQAQAVERIGALIAEVLDKLEMRRTVVGVGLEFNVGNAGKRLTAAQRQKIGLVRALVKQPDLLVINDATAVLDGGAQSRLLAAILKLRPGRAVIWVLGRPALSQHFDTVLALREGRVVAQGRFEELKQPGSAVAELLAAE